MVLLRVQVRSDQRDTCKGLYLMLKSDLGGLGSMIRLFGASVQRDANVHFALQATCATRIYTVCATAVQMHNLIRRMHRYIALTSLHCPLNFNYLFIKPRHRCIAPAAQLHLGCK